MPVIAIDLGGTKLAAAVFKKDGSMIVEEKIIFQKHDGHAVGELILSQVRKFLLQQKQKDEPVDAIGICVPGIYNQEKGEVWAPNIDGWKNYPLLEKVQSIAGRVPVVIDSDRACYMLGEWWRGAAENCTDAIYLAVGTGIGAGILANGKIVRGAHSIAGAIGWMALERPFNSLYEECGCFESMASGEGIAKLANQFIEEKSAYSGLLKNKMPLTSYDVFAAYDAGDVLAKEVIESCIELWGMAIANLVNLLDPEKIILGGGVFGPAIKLMSAIQNESAKWAQPISMKRVIIEPSALGNHAGLYGAAYMALQQIQEKYSAT